MGGPSTPTNTTSNIITTQNLPEWYTSYLQNVMGRAVTQADSTQPPPPTQQIAPLTPDQQNAYQDVRVAQQSATPYYNAADSAYQNAQGVNFQSAIAPGVGMMDAAGNRDTASSAAPYINQGAGYLQNAAGGSSLNAANPYIQQSVAPTGLQSASPYLGAAAQSGASGIDAYMNPYTQQVTDRIAALGARNLQENLLPQISDQFVRAGQFGSPQQRDIIGRALRDENESVLGQQAQALQQGFGQAVSASQADLARQAGLAGTAGGLGTAQQQTLLSAGAQTGQLSSSDLARLQASGVDISQLGLGYAGAQGADASRMLQAGSGTGQLGLSAAQSQAQNYLNSGLAQQNLGTTGNDQTLKNAAALESVGASQQGQGQANLNSLYNQQTQQYNLPWDTIAKLSGVIQGLPVSPSQSANSVTSTPGPSATSQLAGIGLGVAGLANSGIFKAKGGRVVKYKRTHSYGNTPKRGIAFEDAA